MPLAGATFGVPHYMTEAASVLPILALVAGLGVDQLIALVDRRPLEDDVTRGLPSRDGTLTTSCHDPDAASAEQRGESAGQINFAPGAAVAGGSLKYVVRAIRSRRPASIA